MDLFSEIDRAIKGNPQSPLLKFGTYRIESFLGGGGQGRVYKIQHPIGKAFALKLYWPKPEAVVSETENIENFRREVKFLASFNHKNIIGVKTAGLARLEWKSRIWSLTEGVSIPLSGDGRIQDAKDVSSVLFYVMDFVELRVSNVFPISQKRYDSKMPAIAPEFKADSVTLFERLARHILDALICCHSQDCQLVHKDIKADNILFRKEDRNFVLADFGFSRHVDSQSGKAPIILFENIHARLIQNKNFTANDIFEFALVLQKILPALKDAYDVIRFRALNDAIRSVINRADSNNPLNDARVFKISLERYFSNSDWGLRIRLGDSLLRSETKTFVFDSKVQLPVSGPVLLTAEVKHIIDAPEFQRLRGVRQLGPTYFVFPGAYHTRFEHSLGVYSFALRYLERLTRLPEFNLAAEPLDYTIKLVLLTALLHDIGHYPYSHWIEELKPLPRRLKLQDHEARASEIIESSIICDLIKNEWKVKPTDVIDVICGERLTDRNKFLAHSIVNSIFDVDKLDYLIRDSIHCGVKYGEGLDPERLLDSLYIDARDAEQPKICLTQKGGSYLSSLLACRNIMYQEVYWHKTVRVCTSMFKMFFFHYVRREKDRTLINSRFELPDDVFISELLEWVKEGGHADLQPLIEPFAYKGRKLFKPAYIFSTSSQSESIAARQFFGALLRTTNYTEIVSIGKRMARALRRKCGTISEMQIILETTPVKPGNEKYEFKSLGMWDSRKRQYSLVPDKVGFLNEYLESNRQAFIFCHPDHYATLQGLTESDWRDVFETVHGRALSE